MQVYKFLSAPNAPVEGTLMYKFVFCDIQVLIVKKIKSNNKNKNEIKRKMGKGKGDSYPEFM